MNNRAKRNNPLLTLLILPLLLALGAQAAPAAGLRILYSNDNLGELADCG